jgi:hypothetical protein
MTISPDAGPGYAPEPYDVPRGTCPSCRSGRVTHHVYGYPVDPLALDDLPAWVDHGGCVRMPWDRSCGACGATWDDDAGDLSPQDGSNTGPHLDHGARTES